VHEPTRPNVNAIPLFACYQIDTKSLIRLDVSQNESSRKSFTCGYFRLAMATGLEPATTGSTVQTDKEASWVWATDWRVDAGRIPGRVGQGKAWKVWPSRSFFAVIRVNCVKSGIRKSPEGLHL
jgi:hypothetical protein